MHFAGCGVFWAEERSKRRCVVVTTKINFWTFTVALLWIIVTGIAGFGCTGSVLGINLWYVVLFGSLITFIVGLYGFAGGKNFTFRVRSVLTTIITLGLAIFSAVVIVMAHFFQFT